MKRRRALLHPPDEFGQSRMGLKRLDGVEIAGEFRLGQGGVDFVVANLVQQDRGPALAAAQTRDQVVVALVGLGRDRTAAKRAGWGLVAFGVKARHKRRMTQSPETARGQRE